MSKVPLYAPGVRPPAGPSPSPAGSRGASPALAPPGEREFFIDNLLIRIHLIIEMILVDRPCAMGILQDLAQHLQLLLHLVFRFQDSI